MLTEYALVKFLHVVVAVIGMGTSAGLGIVLEFYSGNPVHGPFVLRMIFRLIVFVVAPAYVLMLVTGGWLTHLSWSFTTKWIYGALWLWGIGAVLLPLSLVVLRKQAMQLERSGAASTSYKRLSLVSRLLGGGFGLVVVAVLYLMVVKP